MLRSLQRSFAVFLVIAFGFVGFAQTVQAAMVDTGEIIAVSPPEQNRARVAAALDRPDVVAQLEQLGIAKADAQSRVAALSDQEAAQLAGRLDSLPAGGDGIIGALLLVFFVLLVTDILGLTKVFPFTRSHR